MDDNGGDRPLVTTPAGPDHTPGAGGPAVSGAVAGLDRRWRWAIEWLVVLAVAVAVAFGVRAYVIQSYLIPSASMEPTLMIGDRILVNKLSYHLHGVGRGDIVVFATPPKEAADTDHQGSGQTGHRLARRRHLVQGWPGLHRRQAAGRAVASARHGDHGPAPADGAPERVLRDGGQPVRFPGQPLLRPHPPVPHRGSCGAPGSGPCPAFTSFDLDLRPGSGPVSPPPGRSSSSSKVVAALVDSISHAVAEPRKTTGPPGGRPDRPRTRQASPGGAPTGRGMGGPASLPRPPGERRPRCLSRSSRPPTKWPKRSGPLWLSSTVWPTSTRSPKPTRTASSTKWPARRWLPGHRVRWPATATATSPGCTTGMRKMRRVVAVAPPPSVPIPSSSTTRA